MRVIFYGRDFSMITQPALEIWVDGLKWSDVGGAEFATLKTRGQDADLYQLSSLMRAPVEIFDDFGLCVWWGYLNEVSVAGPAYTWTVQMDTMYNQVKTAYSYAEPGTQTISERRTTAAAIDATSQAIYGVKEALLNGGTLSDAAAEQHRDTALLTHANPQGAVTFGGGENEATLVCNGWWSTLGWRMAVWPSVLGLSFETNNADQNIGDAAGSTRGMQQITVGSQAINVLSAQVYLRKSGSPADNLTVEIYELDGSGNPTGSALTSGTLAGGSITTSDAWVGVTLTEAELAANTQYGLVVRRSGANDGSNYYIWRVDTGLGYTDGAFKLWNGSAWVARGTDADGTLRVYVNNKVLSGTQVKEMVTTYGQFITAQIFEVAISSTLALSSYRDGDTTAREEIEALMAAGTTNGRRILARVDQARRIIWSEEPAPTSIGYHLKRDGQLFGAASGAAVRAYLPPVGVWVLLADMPGTADVSRLIDASKQYMRAAEWARDKGLTPLFRGTAGIEIFNSGNPGEMKALVQGMVPVYVPLQTPLTSTSWDGDSYSTTGKTLIDLSAVFGVPAGVLAVLLRIACNDSGSASGNCYFGVAPNSTADLYALVCKPYGRPNDSLEHEQGLVPCDANGDIYFQCLATGAGTLDVNLQIWGYWM